MDVRWLKTKAVWSALRRPSCRSALGLLALGLSAFAWPHFPEIAGRVGFASMFSLGVATAGAWLGRLIDRSARPRAPSSRLP